MKTTAGLACRKTEISRCSSGESRALAWASCKCSAAIGCSCKEGFIKVLANDAGDALLLLTYIYQVGCLKPPALAVTSAIMTKIAA